MNRRRRAAMLGTAVFFLFLLPLPFHHRAGGEGLSEELRTDGTLNNDYFGIVTGEEVDAKTALENKDRLQTALEWAAENGEALGLADSEGRIQVKLEKGVYLLDGQHEQVYFASDQSLELPSNISLDLNGSVLRQIPGEEQGYALLMIYGTENIKIFGGTLIGDKDEHSYVDDASHEWGFGIDIRGGKRIVLEDLEIYNMTGDSIIMGGKDTYLSEGGILPEDISVINCRLHDNRRQGISVMGVESLLIENCEIYNIGIENGTPPRYGIDLENELDWPVTKTTIRDNRFYNNQGGAILVQRESSHTLIEHNTIDGDIGMVYGLYTTISHNTFKNGGVFSLDTSEPKYTVIDSNEFENGGVNFALNSGVVISNNIFDAGSVTLDFSSGAVYQNTFTNNATEGAGAIEITASGLLSEEMEFYVYVNGNSIDGSFTSEYQADSSGRLTVITQKEAVESYISNFLEDLSTGESVREISYLSWNSSKGRKVQLILIGAAFFMVVVLIIIILLRRRIIRRKKTE